MTNVLFLIMAKMKMCLHLQFLRLKSEHIFWKSIYSHRKRNRALAFEFMYVFFQKCITNEFGWVGFFCTAYAPLFCLLKGLLLLISTLWHTCQSTSQAKLANDWIIEKMSIKHFLIKKVQILWYCAYLNNEKNSICLSRQNVGSRGA